MPKFKNSNATFWVIVKQCEHWLYRDCQELIIVSYQFQALYFYNLAGASIDPRTLQHVAKVCANVDLSDHVVGVIFTIFDEDGDGALSNKEFVAVMKNKLKRGLEKPKDTGLFNFLTAVTKCAKLTPKTVTEAVARETFH